jgi:hypothetical protein
VFLKLFPHMALPHVRNAFGKHQRHQLPTNPDAVSEPVSAVLRLVAPWFTSVSSPCHWPFLRLLLQTADVTLVNSHRFKTEAFWFTGSTSPEPTCYSASVTRSENSHREPRSPHPGRSREETSDNPGGGEAERELPTLEGTRGSMRVVLQA